MIGRYHASVLIWMFLSLASLTGCGSIIEVVPYSPPTSTPAPTATVTPGAAGEASGPQQIVASSIALDAPVVAMGWQAVEQGGQWLSRWDMPDDEAAWHKNSARPGEGSNVVISGHNASTGGHVFANLDDLEIGDVIILQNEADEPFVYAVKEKNIVRTLFSSSQDQTYLLNITQPTPHEQLTLITCWPNWSNTHRLVVIAELQ